MARGLIKHSKWTPNWRGHKESQCLVLSELTGARQSGEGEEWGSVFAPGKNQASPQHGVILLGPEGVLLGFYVAPDSLWSQLLSYESWLL